MAENVIDQYGDAALSGLAFNQVHMLYEIFSGTVTNKDDLLVVIKRLGVLKEVCSNWYMAKSMEEVKDNNDKKWKSVG